jgi:hypothetical protein
MYQRQCKMLYSMEEHVFVRTFYQTSCFFIVQNFDMGQSYLQSSVWYRSLNFCICQVSCDQCSIVLMPHWIWQVEIGWYSSIFERLTEDVGLKALISCQLQNTATVQLVVQYSLQCCVPLMPLINTQYYVPLVMKALFFIVLQAYLWYKLLVTILF